MAPCLTRATGLCGMLGRTPWTRKYTASRGSVEYRRLTFLPIEAIHLEMDILSNTSARNVLRSLRGRRLCPFATVPRGCGRGVAGCRLRGRRGICSSCGRGALKGGLPNRHQTSLTAHTCTLCPWLLRWHVIVARLPSSVSACGKEKAPEDRPDPTQARDPIKHTGYGKERHPPQTSPTHRARVRTESRCAGAKKEVPSVSPTAYRNRAEHRPMTSPWQTSSALNSLPSSVR